MRPLLSLFFISLGLCVHAENYNISDFIHQFDDAHLKSFIETSGERKEIPKHTAIQFLRAELPQLADHNSLLPLEKPAPQHPGAFMSLRAQFIRLLENTEMGKDLKWSDENPTLRLAWANDGDRVPSYVNLSLVEAQQKQIDGRILRPASAVSFNGHINPPLSKFSQSWSMGHEIASVLKKEGLISHLFMENSSKSDSIALRLRSSTLNSELITTLSSKFKIFPNLTDIVSAKTLAALSRAKLIFR